jgi:hypothetical protein
VQGLFAGAELSVETLRFGGPAAPQDFREGSAVNVVAGRTLSAPPMRTRLAYQLDGQKRATLHRNPTSLTHFCQT